MRWESNDNLEMCFDYQVNNTIYSKYSQISFVLTVINRNPCISPL